MQFVLTNDDSLLAVSSNPVVDLNATDKTGCARAQTRAHARAHARTHTSAFYYTTNSLDRKATKKSLGRPAAKER